MSERTAGWRQGPDGQWFPPIDKRNAPRLDADRLAEIAHIVNSCALRAEIDDVVDDPELAV